MRKTNVVKLLPELAEKKYLIIIGDRCSALWNAANYLCRQSFIAGFRVPNYSVLCGQMKDTVEYRALPTHIGQEVLKKLAKSWLSFIALKRAYARGEIKDAPGMPRYRKNRKTGKRPCDYIPVKSTAAYSAHGNLISLAAPADIHKGRISLPFRGIMRHQGQCKTCELHYDKVKLTWYANVVVESHDRLFRTAALPEKQAAGDIGARRTVTISMQSHPLSVVYSARAAWKDYKYWTRSIAKEKTRLSTQGYKTSLHLQGLFQKRRLRLRHGIEALASDVVATLRKHNVTHLTVGYPVNCRDSAKFGRKTNELVHNFWCFDIMLDILQKHCERFGIAFERVNERGTSSHCHLCGRKVRRPKTDVVVCPVHGAMHADVNASMNMLKKKTPATAGDGAQAAPSWIVKRWNSHRWLPHVKSLLAVNQVLRVAV